jgi:hypothetical protein
MADLFYTVVVIWLLWRIFGGTTKHHVFHQHRYEKPEKKKEGEITVTSVPDAKSSIKKMTESMWIMRKSVV